MNYTGDNNHSDMHQRLSRHRHFQLIRDVVTSYNNNIRINNQYMLEYNRNMCDIIAYLRELNSQDVRYYGRPMRRPQRPPPPPPQSPPPTPRRNFIGSDYVTPDISQYTVPEIPSNDNVDATTDDSHTPQRLRTRSLGEFLQGDYPIPNPETFEETVQRIVASNDNPRTSVRTFTTIPNRELSTSFHNTSRNSISELYRILMRDFDGIVGYNNLLETTDSSIRQGLNARELECGLFDASYNVALHGGIDTRCPIGLDNFEDNESIKQIVECGHIFKSEPLLRWFTCHTECPICRCDLRIESESRDVSFNFRTRTENINTADTEREIDVITNSITRIMIDSIERDAELIQNTNYINNNEDEVNNSSSSDSD